MHPVEDRYNWADSVDIAMIIRLSSNEQLLRLMFAAAVTLADRTHVNRQRLESPGVAKMDVRVRIDPTWRRENTRYWPTSKS